MKCRSLIAAGFFLSALVASAAETPTDPSEKLSFLDVLAAGGIMMYPLALMSVLTVVLILVFLLTIRRNAIVSDRFMNTAEGLLGKRDYLGLIDYSDRRNECIARIAQKTITFLDKNPEASYAEVRELTESEGARQAGKLSGRIAYLADIGAIAPMVGLLGTVLGMMKSFISISAGDVQGVRQMQLAGGVSEALITTASGLMISITALIFYAIFRGRVQKFTAELEAAATHIMALINAQLNPASRRVLPSDRQRNDLQQPIEGDPLRGGRPDLHGI